MGLQRRADLAGAAHLELVSGVVQLRPQDAMAEAMLRGWWAQQAARGLREETVTPRERLVRRFLEYTNEYPWAWTPGHVDEWRALHPPGLHQQAHHTTVHVPAVRWNGPTQPLDDEHRWNVARRLLHDDTPPSRHRTVHSST
ncbi:hypothetical protein ACFU7T_32975 [Streptomyces sp. NPDC057555]|uniref:hypothetical protein n=1 Tax=Streptomyces sp. NPDC057555 TaxID=3346166 RepID=UPI0036A8888D